MLVGRLARSGFGGTEGFRRVRRAGDWFYAWDREYVFLDF